VGGTGRQPPGDRAGSHDDADSAGPALGYDPGRARARLALIEQRVTLAEALKDLEREASRPASPPGASDPWGQSRLEAERAADEARRYIGELAPLAGDPETVTDEQGRLPRDRREAFLVEFAAKVNAEAGALGGKLPALRADLKAVHGRQERAAIRQEVRRGAARLAYLQALPPLTADEMCSECPWPMAWHATGVTFCLQTGAILAEPCRSWPVWNAKIAAGAIRVAEMLIRKEREKETAVPAPASGRLAVIAAGSSVEDVIGRLARVQDEHPGAQVRAGEQGAWEIWSGPGAD
jgi:hypothetical protein